MTNVVVRGDDNGMEDESAKKTVQKVAVGQDLSDLSLAELQDRLKALEEEIARTHQEIDRKTLKLDQAHAFFKAR
jgi:uncharacterized small protein (DUF1192 family)